MLRLGTDITEKEAVLEEITFENVITSVQSNYPIISEEAVREAYMLMLEARVEDARKLLNDNMGLILERCKDRV